MPTRVRLRMRLALSAVCAAVMLPSCSDAPAGPSSRVPVGGGVITFAFGARPELTMRVAAGAATVAAAESYLRTGEGPRIPSGPIVRGPGIDERYPYHFLPDAVDLVDVAMELCDGAPMLTPAEVNEFMRGATGEPFPASARWCPWSAVPVAVTRMHGSD